MKKVTNPQALDRATLKKDNKEKNLQNGIGIHQML